MVVSTRLESDSCSAPTVDDPEDFVKVATSRGRVREGQTDDLLGIDNEHRSDGEGDALSIDVGSILVVQHIVQGSDLTLLVGDLKNTVNLPS